MKRVFKNLIALAFGLLVSLMLIEVVLRLYNPFNNRVKGNEIVLPANKTYHYTNNKISRLSREIIHHKNSLGFRGPELPDNEETIRIFCVGGSTTECFYLNDGEDWPARMSAELTRQGKKVWVNNAGLDGHSTRGHIVLIRDHISRLKPDYVVFLVGCNDLAAKDFSRFEEEHLTRNMRFLHRFETFNLYLQFRNARAAAKRGLGHEEVDVRNWAVADTANWIKSNLDKAVMEDYRKRIHILIALTRGAGATPVFVTQPVLFDNIRDPETGVYLGNLRYLDESGLHYRHKLMRMNDFTAAFAGEKGVTCIRGEQLLPSSTAYYYDFFHYTAAGAEVLGKRLGEVLSDKLKK